MERRKALMLSVLGVTGMVAFGGATAWWRQAEGSSYDVHRIASDGQAELWASCDPNSLSGPLYPPTNFAASVNVLPNEAVQKARKQEVRVDWLGELSYERDIRLPGTLNLLYKYYAVNRYNPDDIIVATKVLEGSIFCPGHLLQTMKPIPLQTMKPIPSVPRHDPRYDPFRNLRGA